MRRVVGLELRKRLRERRIELTLLTVIVIALVALLIVLLSPTRDRQEESGAEIRTALPMQIEIEEGLEGEILPLIQRFQDAHDEHPVEVVGRTDPL